MDRGQTLDRIIRLAIAAVHRVEDKEEVEAIHFQNKSRTHLAEAHLLQERLEVGVPSEESHRTVRILSPVEQEQLMPLGRRASHLILSEEVQPLGDSSPALYLDQ